MIFLSHPEEKKILQRYVGTSTNYAHFRLVVHRVPGFGGIIGGSSLVRLVFRGDTNSSPQEFKIRPKTLRGSPVRYVYRKLKILPL